MKKFFFLYIFILSPCFGDPGWQDRFFVQLDRRQFDVMEKTLRAWKTARPNDPELPAAFGYYYYSRAVKGSLNVLAFPFPREAVVATHPFAPETCAFRYGVLLDPDLAQRAMESWKEALKLNSGRLDLYFNLADLYQDEGDFEAQNHILGKALQYSDGSDEPMIWLKNGSLPQPQRQFLPQALQSYVDYYYSLQDPKADERGYRLAKLMATFYSADPAGYNSMAAYFSFKKDWEHTLKYLLVAHAKAPKDSLVLANIACVMEELHQERVAKIYWRKVVRLNNDAKYVELAKERLEKLGSREEASKHI